MIMMHTMMRTMTMMSATKKTMMTCWQGAVLLAGHGRPQKRGQAPPEFDHGHHQDHHHQDHHQDHQDDDDDDDDDDCLTRKAAVGLIVRQQLKKSRRGGS